VNECDRKLPLIEGACDRYLLEQAKFRFRLLLQVFLPLHEFLFPFWEEGL